MTYKVRAISTIDSEQFSSMEFFCSSEELPARLAGLADMMYCDGGMIAVKQVGDWHAMEVQDDREESGAAGGDGEATEDTVE